MSAFVLRSLGGVFLVLLLAVVLGCGGGISRKTGDVTGTVNVDGLPLENGVINFTPLDGGPTQGAPIKDGKYTANNITVGKSKVSITATGGSGAPAGGFSYASHEQMKEMMAHKDAQKVEAKKKTAKTVPADAEGNNQEQTITTGKQELNFDLKTRGKAK